MDDKPAEKCIDCHFFSSFREKVGSQSGHRQFLEWTIDANARDKLRKKGDIGNRPHPYRCAMQTWIDTLPGTEQKISSEELYVLLLDIDRAGQCFYYKHNPWMGIEAAKILQRRQEQNSRDEKDRELTRQAIKETKEATRQTKNTGLATAILALVTFIFLSTREVEWYVTVIFGLIFIFLFRQFISIRCPAWLIKKIKRSKHS